jgi:hypothetical protein
MQSEAFLQLRILMLLLLQVSMTQQHAFVRQYSGSTAAVLSGQGACCASRQGGAGQPHNVMLLCRRPSQLCGIIGIFKQEGPVNVELYEGLLMLQVHTGLGSIILEIVVPESPRGHLAFGSSHIVVQKVSVRPVLQPPKGSGHTSALGTGAYQATGASLQACRGGPS